MNSENKKLLTILTMIWVGIVIYLFLYYTVDPIRIAITNSNESLQNWITSNDSHIWIIIMCFFISFLGSATVGFPIPFGLIIISFATTIYNSYKTELGTLLNVINSPSYWILVIPIVLISGLGCALGESTSYAVGRGINSFREKNNKEINEETSGISHNIEGLKKVIEKNPKSIPRLIFIFAITGAPDDAIFVPLGMMKYPLKKALIFSWLGKNFLTLLYLVYPILMEIGFSFLGENTFSANVVNDTIMFGISMTIVIIVLMYDWNNILPDYEDRDIKKLERQLR